MYTNDIDAEKNNLDKALVDLAEALYDYRNNIISGTSSMSTKAKLIMQRFFPKSSSAVGSSSIPETLKRETIKAYEAALLSGTGMDRTWWLVSY